MFVAGKTAGEMVSFDLIVILVFETRVYISV